MDTNGRFVIAPRFGYANKFADGLALVTTAPANDYWKPTTLFGYIDKSGELVIPEQFNWALPFSEGVAAVCKGPCRGDDLPNARIGYIDRKGRYALLPQWPYGWAAVLQGEKIVFIDTAGNVVLRPDYRGVGRYSEGLAAACISDCDPSSGRQNWGYTDKKGVFVTRPQFGDKPGPFRNGLALVCFGCTG